MYFYCGHELTLDTAKTLHPRITDWFLSSRGGFKHSICLSSLEWLDFGLHVMGCFGSTDGSKATLPGSLFTSDTCCLFPWDLQREGSAPLKRLEIIWCFPAPFKLLGHMNSFIYILWSCLIDVSLMFICSMCYRCVLLMFHCLRGQDFHLWFSVVNKDKTCKMLQQYFVSP